MELGKHEFKNQKKKKIEQAQLTKSLLVGATTSSVASCTLVGTVTGTLSFSQVTETKAVDEITRNYKRTTTMC